MNKSELVELIAEKADISKAKAALAVDAFTAGVADALAKGDEVALEVLVPSRPLSAKPARAVTRRPARKSRLLLPRCRSSALAKL